MSVAFDWIAVAVEWMAFVDDCFPFAAEWKAFIDDCRARASGAIASGATRGRLPGKACLAEKIDMARKKVSYLEGGLVDSIGERRLTMPAPKNPTHHSHHPVTGTLIAAPSPPGTYSEAAKTFISEFDGFVAKLAFGLPLTKEEMRAYRPGLKPSDAVLEKACSIWEQYGTKTGLQQFDAVSVRESIRYATTMRQVTDRMEKAAMLGDAEIFRYQGWAGHECLTLFAAMKVTARRPEGAFLAPAIKDMANLLKAGGTRAGARPRKPRSKHAKSGAAATGASASGQPAKVVVVEGKPQEGAQGASPATHGTTGKPDVAAAG
jgi:hypothetical protein